jgi:hypothetical protein
MERFSVEINIIIAHLDTGNIHRKSGNLKKCPSQDKENLISRKQMHELSESK